MGNDNQSGVAEVFVHQGTQFSFLFTFHFCILIHSFRQRCFADESPLLKTFGTMPKAESCPKAQAINHSIGAAKKLAPLSMQAATFL